MLQRPVCHLIKKVGAVSLSTAVMAADIVIVGSCVQDLTSYTPRFPRPGESVRGYKFVTGFGGKGANQAVMTALLGARTAMVGKVGRDVFGPATVDNFKAHGMNTEHMHITDSASTGTATITVSESGENCIVVVLGANEQITESEVKAAEKLISQAKILVCQLEIPTDAILVAMKIANQNSVPVLFNPAPGIPNLPPELIACSDIICPNENEAEILTGLPADNVDKAKVGVTRLLEMGAKTAIVTLGPKGSVFATKNEPEVQHIECPKVKAVDTTGAGDAFVGTLAYLSVYFGHLSLKERIKRASLVAAQSVQHPGTQTSYVAKEKLDPSIFA